MNNNVSIIRNCYGCGVCAASCGKKIISIELNSDGFYEPRIIEPTKCTDCGICLDVCAFNHSEKSLSNDEVNVKSWAAWSNALKSKIAASAVNRKPILSIFIYINFDIVISTAKSSHRTL